METKRTKLWRRKQGFRVFKSRLIYRAAACENVRYDKNSKSPLGMLHWYELAKEHWMNVYRTTGTPCSCEMCRGAEYNRLIYKRETQRIIRESED